MKTFIFGDSHTAIFASKTIAYSPGPITLRNFCSPENILKNRISQFHMQHGNAGDVVVLCLSEIDIRAHFWRDFPVFHSKGMSLQDFVSMHATKFISSCQSFYAERQLGAMIIWGAPAASHEGKLYNPNFPFVGSPVTRNIITHELNMAIMREIRASGSGFNLRFTTFFYNMVDAAFSTDVSYFGDGVHLDGRLTDFCWRILEETVSNSTPITVDSRFHQLQDLRYQCALEDYTATDRIDAFDAWLDTGRVSSTEIPQRQIALAVNGQTVNIGLFDAPAISRMKHIGNKLTMKII